MVTPAVIARFRFLIRSFGGIYTALELLMTHDVFSRSILLLRGLVSRATTGPSLLLLFKRH